MGSITLTMTHDSLGCIARKEGGNTKHTRAQKECRSYGSFHSELCQLYTWWEDHQIQRPMQHLLLLVGISAPPPTRFEILNGQEIYCWNVNFSQPSWLRRRCHSMSRIFFQAAKLFIKILEVAFYAESCESATKLYLLIFSCSALISIMKRAALHPQIQMSYQRQTKTEKNKYCLDFRVQHAITTSSTETENEFYIRYKF